MEHLYFLRVMSAIMAIIGKYNYIQLCHEEKEYNNEYSIH